MKEKSCGVVPVQQQNGVWHVLIIQHRAGHWSFPKGKQEAGESDKETACRELFEETNLSVTRFFSDEPFIETYIFSRMKTKVSKSVIYFVAEVDGEVRIEHNELLNARWATFHEASVLLTFSQAKELLKQAEQLLHVAP